MNGKEKTRKQGEYAGRVMIIAAGYYISGRLGLLLAIAPGYPTAVLPASGIALAGMLLFGYRVWPGIVLGSFFMNVWTSLDTTSTASIVTSLSLSAGIGVGAALQAFVAAFLIRRFVGFPNPLARIKDVVQFLVLGGPLSCLVSASIGVTVLWFGGVFQETNYLVTWWTWWVGDTMGVLIFTPLVFIWTAEPREIWRRRRIFLALPVGLSSVMTILFFIYTSTWEQKHIKLAFERRAIILAKALEKDIGVYLEVLRAAEGFYNSSPRLDRHTFRTFVGHSLSRYSAIQALSWNPRVPDARRLSYEEAMQQEGYPGFQITEPNALGQLVRASHRTDYVSVSYIEPYGGNESALGFDVASNPTCLEALNHARDTGKPIATARITLVQEIGNQFGFLVFLPVYGKGQPRHTVEERRRNLEGYMVGAFRVGDLVGAALEGFGQTGIELRLYDEAAPEGERLLYRGGVPDETAGSADGGERLTGLQWSTTLEIAGRRWDLRFYSPVDATIVPRTWQAWSALAGGFLFTSVLGAFLLVVTGYITRIERTEAVLLKLYNELEQRVVERTNELQEANVELQLEAKERRQLEEERIRTQRLRAVGELAAGISHNLNNVLTGVQGPAQMIQKATDDPHLLELAEWILSSVGRASELIRRLNQSVRGESNDDLQPVDVNAVVEMAVEDTRPRWKDEPESRGVAIEVVTALEDIPPIRGTPVGLHDILTNLVFNAVDAMPEGGTLTLATQTVTDGVLLTVGDTGTGMDVETQRRVFEPFFTTKMDVGSGLGLSTVYGTVTGWGGSIEVESTPGEGATFTLHLPSWRGLEAAEEAPEEMPPLRRAKILVVEDEEIVRRVLLRHLSHDHEVAVAVDGQEAMEVFAPGRYDVAFIDLGMPGMPGDRVAEAMREADPRVVTVLITGWSLKEDDPRLSAFDFQLSKPLKLDAVEAVVARAVAMHDDRAAGKK